MLNKRKFSMLNGKPQIKLSSVVLDHLSRQGIRTSQSEMFENDKRYSNQHKACSFLRPYIPGEYDGHRRLSDQDLRDITHTYVICDASDGHVLHHLSPIGETFKALVYDMDGGYPKHVRVPLLPEQAKLIEEHIRMEG